MKKTLFAEGDVILTKYCPLDLCFEGYFCDPENIENEIPLFFYCSSSKQEQELIELLEDSDLHIAIDGKIIGIKRGPNPALQIAGEVFEVFGTVETGGIKEGMYYACYRYPDGDGKVIAGFDNEIEAYDEAMTFGMEVYHSSELPDSFDSERYTIVKRKKLEK